MKRNLLILLTLMMLFGQWASTEHAYHEHFSGGSCEECIVSQPIDPALSTEIQISPIWGANTSLVHTPANLPSCNTPFSYRSRAPPIFA